MGRAGGLSNAPGTVLGTALQADQFLRRSPTRSQPPSPAMEFRALIQTVNSSLSTPVIPSELVALRGDGWTSQALARGGTRRGPSQEPVQSGSEKSPRSVASPRER